MLYLIGIYLLYSGPDPFGKSKGNIKIKSAVLYVNTL